MSVLAPTGLDSKQSGSGILPKLPVTYTSVANLNTVIRLNEKNDRLHKISISFSYQFAFRYLYGKDLEFDDDKIKAAQGYLKDTIGYPNYVVIVSIKPGQKRQKEINGFFLPDINREIYAEIAEIGNNEK